MPDPVRWVDQASARYSVYVGQGLLGGVGEVIASTLPGRVPYLLINEVVLRLYGDEVIRSFSEPPDVLVIPDGERFKTFETVQHLITTLIEHGAHRDSALVVVGGGVTGDVGGFVGAIFLRGVPIVHVPTTLLAQVDSSIGGKVAVNHPRGKNLVGSFHPPTAVVSDVDVLATLEEGSIRCGIFEAIKSGVIADGQLFELLRANPGIVHEREASTMIEIVTRSIAVKAEIVEDDERENDRRRLLNYGHTIGHGIETALDYRLLTHGDAIAWGMIAANEIAVRRGIMEDRVRRTVDDAILAFVPARLVSLDPDRLIEAVSHDKKFRVGHRVMVLATGIGRCAIVDDISIDEIRRGIDAMLSASEP